MSTGKAGQAIRDPASAGRADPELDVYDEVERGLGMRAPAAAS
ncbi:hypothetical protein [Micromonospora sp. NPDC023956]